MDTDMKSEPRDAESFVDLAHYRNLVRTYIDMRRYKTALFWAEKVVALGGQHEDAKDVYWMAQCMFLLREYHRAAHVIRSRSLERTNLYCLYLAAESLFEAKDCAQAIELLNGLDAEANNPSPAAISLAQLMADGNDAGETGPEAAGAADRSDRGDLLAAIWLLKGRVLETMDNRAMAMDAYVQALQHSVHCTEALDALVQHEMLMAWEEQELMGSLPIGQQCRGEAEAKVLRMLYGSKLKKYYESNCPLTNAEQTPNMNYDSMKSIKVLTDKLKTEHSEDLKFNRRTSKWFTPNPRITILSPANKLLQDLRTTPNYSIQSSLSRTSFSQLGDSIKSSPPVVAAPGPAPSSNSIPPTDAGPAAAADGSAAAAAAAVPIPLTEACTHLEQSVDMMVARAEKMFYNCEYKRCMQLLDECFQMDPYHSAGLTVQIGCLVELKESNKLFYLAHNLIDLYPDQAISWYAVGCYYDLNNKSDPARRYLAKATALDRLFGPAWLAYGHSFAKENEHDQAMAAYFKATQLMRGCHLPLLYIGVECGLTKNHELAEKFFYQAMSIAPLDVFVLHELGVNKFECEDYVSAEDILRGTLDVVGKMCTQNGKPCLSPRWEPLLNNLGHCCRKNGKYSEALQFHQRALALKPLCASTYTAIGFVLGLMGRHEEAIEALHSSLSIKRDDIFATTMLRYCIEDLIEEDAIPEGLLANASSSDESGTADFQDVSMDRLAAAATMAAMATMVPKKMCQLPASASGATLMAIGSRTAAAAADATVPQQDCVVVTAMGPGGTTGSMMTLAEARAAMLAGGPSSSAAASAAAASEMGEDGPAIKQKLKFDDSMMSAASAQLDSSLDMSM